MADDDSVSSTSHGSNKRPNTTPRASPKKFDVDEEGIRALVRVVSEETKKTMRDLLEDQQKVHAQQIKQVQSSQVVFIITGPYKPFNFQRGDVISRSKPSGFCVSLKLSRFWISSRSCSRPLYVSGIILLSDSAKF
jgi:predicted RNA-binding protein